MQNRLGLPHIYNSRHRGRLFLPALQRGVLDLKVEKYDQQRDCSVLFKFNGEIDILLGISDNCFISKASGFEW